MQVDVFTTSLYLGKSRAVNLTGHAANYIEGLIQA
jgi:hypothetical protein